MGRRNTLIAMTCRETNLLMFAAKNNKLEDRTPPMLSSIGIWSQIPNEKEIGREEAIYGRADHRLPA